MPTAPIRFVLTLACASLVATFAFSPDAAAQQERSLDLRAGLSFPGGDLSSGYGPGSFASLSLNFPVADRFSLRLSKAIDVFHRPLALLAHDDVVLPEASILRGTGGVVFHLLEAYGGQRFVLDFSAEGGLAAFKAGRQSLPSSEGPSQVYIDIVEFAAMASGGVQLGYRLPGRHIFIGVQGLVAPMKRSATDNFTRVSPELRPINTLVSFPISAGFAAYF